jgi:hypothetical protein
VTAAVFGGDSYDSEELWRQHPALQDVYYTTHAYLGEDNPDPAVQHFRRAYLDAYGSQPGAFAALGYDAARLLMSAIRRAGSIDPEAVLQALGDIHEFTASQAPCAPADRGGGDCFVQDAGARSGAGAVTGPDGVFPVNPIAPIAACVAPVATPGLQALPAKERA